MYETRWTCQPLLVSFCAFPSGSSCTARLKGLRQVLHRGKPRRNWLLCQDCGHRGGRGRAANCRLHQLLCSSHPKLKTKTWAAGQTHKTWQGRPTRPGRLAWLDQHTHIAFPHSYRPASLREESLSLLVVAWPNSKQLLFDPNVIRAKCRPSSFS